jgi:hypothetical protein
MRKDIECIEVSYFAFLQDSIQPSYHKQQMQQEGVT